MPIARARIKLVDPEGGGNYFTAPKTNYQFISSGCAILDCILGGGWPLGRFSNIVGDSSTGKTQLAGEAATNFAMQYPDGKVWYRDTEAAFDKEYAREMGMPVDDVDFGGSYMETVEEFHDDLKAKIAWSKENDSPGLYIIDSLDALSDKATLERDFSDTSYAMTKQKKLADLFSRLNKGVEESKIHVCIISQVRSKIGVAFGDKTTRSGGSSLNFYASQVLYLSHLGNVDRTKNNVKRITGILIRAKMKKCKVGIAQRSCDFPFEFGFGLDDASASVMYLEDVGRLEDAGIAKSRMKDHLRKINSMDTEEYRAERLRLAGIVKQVWQEVETSFLPQRKKYE